MLGYRFRAPYLYCVARDLSWDVGSDRRKTSYWYLDRINVLSQTRYTRALEVQMLPLSFPDLAGRGRSLPRGHDENQQVRNRDQ